MQISQSKSMNTVISWFFLAYFLILFAERTQSVIRACSDVAHSPFGSRFDGYVNILTIFSLFATAALLICANRSFWLSLFQQHICVFSRYQKVKNYFCSADSLCDTTSSILICIGLTRKFSSRSIFFTTRLSGCHAYHRT